MPYACANVSFPYVTLSCVRAPLDSYLELGRTLDDSESTVPIDREDLRLQQGSGGSEGS